MREGSRSSRRGEGAGAGRTTCGLEPSWGIRSNAMRRDACVHAEKLADAVRGCVHVHRCGRCGQAKKESGLRDVWRPVCTKRALESKCDNVAKALGRPKADRSKAAGRN